MLFTWGLTNLPESINQVGPTNVTAQELTETCQGPGTAVLVGAPSAGLRHSPQTFSSPYLTITK